jgi:fumarate hydratase class II
MASEVQKLQTVIDRLARLIEQTERQALQLEAEIKRQKGPIVGPVSPSTLGQELSAYLAGAEQSAKDVRAKLQAAATRAKRAQDNARRL